MRPAEGRVTPNWTAGRRKTGSSHACPDGRPVGDRVASREGAPEATGRRRRTGSLQNGRPAGHCQGCPSLPAFPLGPTTFWMLSRGAISPSGRSRSARGTCNSSGEVSGGRRRFGMGPAAATVRWHWLVDHRGGYGERQQALWPCWCGVYRSTQRFRPGQLSSRLPKNPFLTLRISTSTR